MNFYHVFTFNYSSVIFIVSAYYTIFAILVIFNIILNRERLSLKLPYIVGKVYFVNHFYHYLCFESLIYLLDSNCFPQVFSSIAWLPWSATTAFHLITWPRRRGKADHPWELWSNKYFTIYCSWQSTLGKSWSSFW